MKTFDFISDPGHGWIKCQKSLLSSLGIAERISTYSYMLGDYAYLEEDCDASILCKALTDSKIQFKFRERHCENRQSKIRNYPTYRANQGEQA